MNRRCIIIGSGLGGLSTGAILARNGFEVTILEQSHQIGGCLQCFHRGGAKFETGMHFVGSLDEGQILSNYLKFIGVKDKVQFSRLDTQAYDIISLHGERFPFANGQDQMTEALTARFPEERNQLKAYWELVNSVAQASPYYNLNAPTSNEPLNPQLFTRSINDILDHTIGNPLLRDVLTGNMSLYAAQLNQTPFSTHAFIANFYNNSAFRIIGGSDALAVVLADTIRQHGGTILTGSRVVKALCHNGTMTAVELADGRHYEADLFISDIHPSQLCDIVPEEELRPVYRSRIQSIDNTISVFSLFLKFKPEAMRYLNSNFYGILSDSPWGMEDYTDSSWPRGYIYMHHCHEPHPRYAHCGVMLSYMSHRDLAPWLNTTTGHRGDDYQAFKQAKAEKMLDILERDFPGTKAAVEDYYTATPLTYRDYTLTPEGSMYGMAKDVSKGVAGRVSYRTKIPNLLMVGQNINSHGILGVLVGSITACTSLLGEETISRQMHERCAHASDTQPHTKPSTLVIGGGLGGLVSGALLAKEGHRVTVLEKNHIIGGGLQCFSRNGILYPTGMHIFGGFQPGGQLNKICSYLGILDKLHLHATDSHSFDEIRSLGDNRIYLMPRGREAYTNYLCKQFPHEAEGIRAYVDAIYRLTQEEDLFYLREATHSPMDHSDQMLWPADKFIAHYIHDPELQTLLAYLSPLYAGVHGETPAITHALINVLHIEGTHQFIGGSQQLADALAEVIKQHGGSVLPDEEVDHVDVQNHRIHTVHTRSGHQYEADNYISDVPLNVLLQILPRNAFPPSFRHRLQEAPCSYSAFKVYIKFKDRTFPYINRPCYCTQKRADNLSTLQCSQDQWPREMMYMTHPTHQPTEYAQTMTIISPMPWEWVRPWEETTVGHRGASYRKWKQQCIGKVLQMLESAHPGFNDCIESVEASSPLTIRDYYGNKEGSLYGLRRDCNNMMLTQLSVYTKVRNLYLTGQDVNIHGMCGVALTAVSTAEAVLQDNLLRCRIAQTLSNE